MTTWREELAEALAENAEAWPDIEAITLNDEQLDREFYEDFGLTEGEAFTVWTAKYVYFPWVYDGSEGVSWVSRHPDGKPTKHVGGG